MAFYWVLMAKKGSEAFTHLKGMIIWNGISFPRIELCQKFETKTVNKVLALSQEELKTGIQGCSEKRHTFIGNASILNKISGDGNPFNFLPKLFTSRWSAKSRKIVLIVGRFVSHNFPLRIFLLCDVIYSTIKDVFGAFSRNKGESRSLAWRFDCQG